MTDSMQADNAAPGTLAQAAPVAPSPAPTEQTAPVAEAEPTKSESLFGDEENGGEERPEWLPKKFNSAEDLSKSYQELEKKLGAHQGSPEEYVGTVTEGLEGYSIPSDDPFALDFAKVLKDNGVNQKTYDDISNLYFNKMKAEEEGIAIAQEHQFEQDCREIGEEKISEIKESIKWAKDILPQETFEMLRMVGDKDMTVGLMINEFHQAYTSKNYNVLPDEIGRASCRERV